MTLPSRAMLIAANGMGDALHPREDFCNRGRPPRLSLSRELDVFRAEVFDPANRANSLIQVFEPKMPAASSAVSPTLLPRLW